jgi:phosphoribosyl-ATP pyrophosphohydrolase
MGMNSGNILARLEGVIEERKSRAAEGASSYVARLIHGGVSAIGAKVTEEAAEVVEAAGEPGAAGQAHLVREVADLVFHALVLMGARGVAWSEVEAELERRFGTSGLEEKARRGLAGGAGEASVAE